MINPAEKTPIYIHVDSFIVQPSDLFKTGSVSHNIKSAWVYFNNQAVGVFDLPATVPILADGPGQVQLVPAVSYSGLSYVRQYPFYESDTFSIPYNPGSVTNHTGITRYRSNANFQMKEDFEIGNSFIKVNTGNTGDTVLRREESPQNVFEGKASGLISLTTDHPSAELITNQGFPIVSGESYLEINYKCTVPVSFGLQTLSNSSIVYEYLYGVYPSDTWKKAYIGLSDFTSQYKTSSYNLMIKTKLGDGETSGYVLIDNIKVISF